METTLDDYEKQIENNIMQLMKNKEIREKKRWQQISIHRQRPLFLKPII